MKQGHILFVVGLLMVLCGTCSACLCGDHGGQCGRIFCPTAFGFYKDYRQHADCHYAEFCCLPRNSGC
ncbi:Hypothetical predicted protein [Mytilus galloprovincialis]|nr:Hypothetical predicted protein [Mytilus galloprovincialis]